MSTAEQLWGLWWVPDDSTKKVPGLLQLVDGNYPRLELKGRLVWVGHEESSTIYGEVGGRPVTLFRASSISDLPIAAADGSAAVESTLLALGGAIVPDGAGRHVESLDQKIFNGARVGIENLHFWDGRTRVSELLKANTATPLQQRAATFEQRFQFEVVIEPARSAIYEDVMIFPLSRYEIPAAGEFRRGELRIAATFGTDFAIDCEAPASLTRILEVSRRLSDLVTLAMNRDSPRRGRIRLHIHDDWFELWSANSSLSEGDDAVLTPKEQRDSLFRLSDIDDFNDLMARWSSLLNRAPYGVDSVIALWRESSTFYENKLIAICSAIEALDRGLHGDHGLTRDPTYASRCKKLLEIPDSTAVEILVGDPDQWVHDVTKTRNDLAHGYPPEERRVSPTTWRVLKDVSRAMLALVVVAKLGLSPEKQLHVAKVGAIQRARLGG